MLGALAAAGAVVGAAADSEGPGAGAGAGKYSVTIMDAILGSTKVGVDTGTIGRLAGEASAAAVVNIKGGKLSPGAGAGAGPEVDAI